MSYRPVVHFSTEKGEGVEFVSSVGYSKGPLFVSYSKGQKVQALYLPATPNDAKINSFFALWGISSIICVVGVCFLLAKPRTVRDARLRETS